MTRPLNWPAFQSRIIRSRSLGPRTAPSLPPALGAGAMRTKGIWGPGLGQSTKRVRLLRPRDGKRNRQDLDVARRRGPSDCRRAGSGILPRREEAAGHGQTAERRVDPDLGRAEVEAWKRPQDPFFCLNFFCQDLEVHAGLTIRRREGRPGLLRAHRREGARLSN